MVLVIKLSNIFRRHIENRKLLLICILLLSLSFIFFSSYFCQYMFAFLFNTIIYVFLLLGLAVLIVRLPWLRFFRAFSSVVRQMSRYNSQRRGTARTIPYFCCSMYCLFSLFYVLFVLCRSVYCLCVNVYCTTATGWQPNCSLQIYQILLVPKRSVGYLTKPKLLRKIYIFLCTCIPRLTEA
jgi:hypothetical protein